MSTWPGRCYSGGNLLSIWLKQARQDADRNKVSTSGRPRFQHTKNPSIQITPAEGRNSHGKAANKLGEGEREIMLCNTDGLSGDEEPRAGQDRRRRTFPPMRYLMAGGRRRKVRRSEDRQRVVILDRYSPKLFGCIVGILFLSLLDAVLTLYLMEHGSTELNPVMDYFLKKGPLVFTIAKYALTSVAVVIFLMVANSVLPRSNFRAKKLFPYALVAFGSVIVWEIMLVFILLLRV